MTQNQTMTTVIAFCYFKHSPSTIVRGVNIAYGLSKRHYKICETYFYSNMLAHLRATAIKRKLPFIKTFCDTLQTHYTRLTQSSRLKKLAQANIIFLVKYLPQNLIPALDAMKKRSGVKLLYDIDDAIWVEKNFAEAKYLDKIFDLVDIITCDNTYLKNTLEKQYSVKLTVVHPYFDQEGYYYTQKFDTSQNLVIGWIGSRVTYKYIQHIQQSLCKVLLENDNVILSLAGVDPAIVQTDFQSFSNQVQCIPNYKGGHEMYEILNSFDIGIFPCFDDNESLGRGLLKIILYMSCGTAVVTSFNDNIPQLVTHDSNGLICKNQSEWASYLQHLVDDSTTRRRLANCGYQTVIDRYSLKNNLDQYQHILPHSH